MAGEARTIAEGGYVDLEAVEWPDAGVAPAQIADYAYGPYEEPAAGPDNKYNSDTGSDDAKLNKGLGELDARIDSLEDQLDDLDQRITDLENQFGSHNHDSRYYQKTQADDRFVDEAGDTMTGPLTIDPSGDRYLTYDGGNSDYTVALEDNHGRVSHLWNAEPGTHTVLDDNEGSAWLSINGGHINLEVANGTPGDEGTPVDWKRAMEIRTSGVKLNEGAELGSSVDMSRNQITNVSKLEMDISAGDALIFSDATGGSNDHPYDIHYNDRNMRFSYDNGITAQFNQDGTTSFFNDVAIKGFSQTLQVGDGAAGPHKIQFGDDVGDGLAIVMRTSPNHLAIETPGNDPDTIGYFDHTQRAVNFSDANYVALPVRGGAPNDPPGGAAWIET